MIADVSHIARSRRLLRAVDKLPTMRQLQETLQSALPLLLFGLRLWASVTLALYIAFWLELDNPFWAGASAGLVCQPQLGASLRKSWFRMIGTLIGAVAIVVLTKCFPQDRALFLLSLILWAAGSAFLATVLRNFASYSAALAGYTAVIIASDQLGAVGGLNGEAISLAITRVTEICIGIASAGIVLAGTDLGGARERLAGLLSDLTSGLATHFVATLALAGSELPDTRPLRRDYIRRVAALDPIIDATIGESSQIRYHSPVLQNAVVGLLAALSGWRAVANHLIRLPGDRAKEEAAAVLQDLPAELLSMPEAPDTASWADDPTGSCRSLDATVARFTALHVRTPSQRLLVDATAETLGGVADALNGLALLQGESALPVRRDRVPYGGVADWLPPFINAGRALVTIGAVALFWIVSAWPNGAVALVWTTTAVILFSPRADQAYATAIGYAIGTFIAAVAAAIITFAILPGLETFPGLAGALALYLIPAGALAALPSRNAVFAAMASWFVPLLGPSNTMIYNPLQFYNTAAAFVAGVAVAALSFRLIPPLSPLYRAARLQARTLRDLRRLAGGRKFRDWERLIHARLDAMPAEATPLQHAQALAALSLGMEIVRLRRELRQLGRARELDMAFAAVAEGRGALAVERLVCLDAMLASEAAADPKKTRVRASILIVIEVLSQHSEYFDAGGAAR